MNWHKVKVGEFLIRVKDLVPITDNEDYKLVTIKLYHKGVKLRKIVKGTEMQADKMSRVKPGQFILSGIDARNGAFGIIPIELDGAVVTNDFWHFEIDTKIISNEYFLWLTSTPYFDDICKKASDGTTNRIRLQADRFFSQELMIPDIRDQHKVVNELKSTSDKIKKLEVEYYFQLTQLENLNQAILQEAVQGKLVKQNPKDEPASELLKRIKSALRQAQGPKKEKPLPPIKPEEIPFEIPESWVWCRLGEICEEIIDCPHSTPKYLSTETGYYGIDTNCIDNSGNITRLRHLSKEGYEERIKRIVPFQNDIVYAREGSIGLAAFIPASKNICLGQRVMLFRSSNGIIPSFLKMIVTEEKYKNRLLEKHRGMGAKHVNVKDIISSLIPLPPLSEQTRIVAEIEKQLAKTKQLKEHIIANQHATEQLLKALLHGAFEVEEKEEVNN